MTTPPDDRGQQKNAPGVTRDLASRIASAKREQDRAANRATGDASTGMNGVSRGMRIGTEFIAAVLVGAFIGYLIDLGLNSSPWGLLIMVLMGFAAGTMNVIRVVTEMNTAASVVPDSATGDDKTGDERNV